MRDFGIGDVIPGVASAALYEAGPARWYALRVAPQREEQAELWLQQRGVYAFHPVRMRKVVRFGKTRDYARRYLPGYVFARFPGEPAPMQVLRSPHILGALTCSGGQWGVLEPERLRALHAMRQPDERQRQSQAALQARKRADARFRVGDSAMFRAGPFAGLPCEVAELKADGGLTLRLMIFGRETVTRADAALIRKLG